jgi:hypothetical protein
MRVRSATRLKPFYGTSDRWIDEGALVQVVLIKNCNYLGLLRDFANLIRTKHSVQIIEGARRVLLT